MGDKKRLPILEQEIFINDEPEYIDHANGEYCKFKGGHSEKDERGKYPRTYRITLSVAAFKDNVEIIKQLDIKKGDLVWVRGIFKCSVWKDDDDKWCEMKNLTVFDIEMVKRKGMSIEDTKRSEPKPVMDMSDDEIPF